MPRLLLIFSQSHDLILIVAVNPHTSWQTVQIQISWLLQKPTDLDLHCLQRLGISRLSRTKVKGTLKKRSAKDLSNDAYAIFLCECFFFWFSLKSIYCGNSFELLWQVDVIQMGTHNICFLTVLPAHDTSVLLLQNINWSRSPWIFTKLSVCIELWKSGLGLLMGKFCKFLTEWSAHDTSEFLVQDNKFGKCQWIFTKLGMCIEIVEVWFGIANGQILSIFDSYLPTMHQCYVSEW